MVKGLWKGDVVTTTKNDCLAHRMSDFFKLTEEIKEDSAGLIVLAVQSTPLTPHHLKTSYDDCCPASQILNGS